MNREEILDMAREVGFEVNFDIWAVSVDGVHINKELQRFAALVAAKEREACAKVCDDLEDASNLGYTGMTAMYLAKRIRDRGKNE